MSDSTRTKSSSLAINENRTPLAVINQRAVAAKPTPPRDMGTAMANAARLPDAFRFETPRLASSWSRSRRFLPVKKNGFITM